MKTLHPNIHAGILARRGLEADLDQLREHEIRTFDLVCVNLYPFQSVTAARNVREEDAVEMIDIGGPALLRAAAKNFVDVVPVCEASRYEEILAELDAGGIQLDTRRRLAAEAFAHTAAYETSIAAWFADVETFPPRLLLSLERTHDLAYGENPHQRAAYYAEAGVRRHLLSRVDMLGGKDLSFNNLNDLDAARAVLREFTLPACVVVKHANPCGVAVAATIEEAYAKAYASDPVSAYGGIVALNRRVSPELAERVERAVRGGRDRAGVRRRGARDAPREGGAADPRRPGAARREPGRPRLPARARRLSRPGHGRRGGRPGGHGRRHGLPPRRGGLGRPALRLARRQARRLECDRDRHATCR